MSKLETYRQELIQILGKVAKNPKDLQAFLTDLLTPNEYDEIITRWQIVKSLKSKIPQREVAKKLGVSIAKVTRGSRVLLKKYGGFQTALKKYGKS